MRLTDEQLKEIMEKYHVDTLWSYSRLDTFRISPYLFFLKYVKKEQPKKDEVSPYGIIGGACHAVLEKFYRQEISYEDMAKEFENEYVVQIELFGLKFNNTDKVLNSSIERKYKVDLEHFFKNYKPVHGKHRLEQFVSMEVIPGIAIGGYIDDVTKEKDGMVHIYDFKTSSRAGFVGKKLVEHSHQLAIYAEAIRQMGIPKEKITASFVMMKYVDVDIKQKNGTTKTSTIERCQIGEKLRSKADMWLKTYGITEYEGKTADDLLAEMVSDNTIEGLPKEVREKFIIYDCYIDVKDIFDIYDALKKEIIDIVADIDNRMHEYKETHDDIVWYDSEESMKKNSYYLTQITEYRIDQIKPFLSYCEKMESENEDLLETKTETIVESVEDFSWVEGLV